MTRTLLGFGTLGLSAVLVLIGLVVRIARRRRSPDRAWIAQTPIQKFTGHNQAGAALAAQRAAKHAESTRKLHAQRSRPMAEPKAQPSSVTPIETRRRAR